MRCILILPLLSAALWAADSEKASPGATQPVLVRSVEPQYSLEGRLVSAQGKAVLDVLIDEGGQVSDVRVGQSLGFGLDQQAAAAVRGWRFQPAMKDGVPVATRANIEVDFRLNEGDSARRWMVKEFVLDGPSGFAPPVAKHGQVPANVSEERSSGEVTVRFRINEAGAVEKAEAAATTETASETERLVGEISEWKFVPGQANGQAIGVDAMLTIYRGSLRQPAATGRTALAGL